MSADSKAVIAWSSGKDSAYALHAVRQSDSIEVVGAMTTLTEEFERVSMHGVRERILDLQASSIDLPLTKVWIPSPCSNEVYERRMGDVMSSLRSQGITHVVFGDLFLEDIRTYRERNLERVGMQALFPLWQRDTAELSREMIASGLRAVLTCVDPRVLESSFAGRTYDNGLLGELPEGVDPCGENGEFHTVVTHGPMFAQPIAVDIGVVVERDGFVFADVVPKDSP